MKREYSTPEMKVEVFEASESVAACYILNCNVPKGFGFFDNNGNKTYDDGDTFIVAGSGCGTKHIGVNEPEGPHTNSMWQPVKKIYRSEKDTVSSKNWYGSAFKTYHWTQSVWGKSEHHFTSDVKWETNPNAS